MSLFDRLFGGCGHHHGCCTPNCCGNGGPSYPGGPVIQGGDVAPLPPAPAAEHAASTNQRRVVQTSTRLVR